MWCGERKLFLFILKLLPRISIQCSLFLVLQERRRKCFLFTLTVMLITLQMSVYHLFPALSITLQNHSSPFSFFVWKSCYNSEHSCCPFLTFPVKSPDIQWPDLVLGIKICVSRYNLGYTGITILFVLLSVLYHDSSDAVVPFGQLVLHHFHTSLLLEALS